MGCIIGALFVGSLSTQGFKLSVTIHPFAHIHTLLAVTSLLGAHQIAPIAQNQEQLRVQFLAQGHYTAGVGDRTSNLPSLDYRSAT